MIYFNGIETKYNTKSQNSLQRQQTHNKIKAKPYSQTQDKKISIEEGGEILFRGVVNQAGEMLNTIIDNPGKTLGLLAATTIGLMAMPIIGIPTAAASGVLAIGFAAVALGKMAYHTALFAKNNEKGTYDIARTNLEKIGRDTFDTALSAPFVPKGALSAKNFIKYGKINNNFIKNGGNIYNIIERDAELARSINYKCAVDKEILKIKDLTAAQKTQIKKDLLEFNVPMDEIGSVVMDKWAQIKGIKAKPKIILESYPHDVHGFAFRKECKISFNDYKKEFNRKYFNEYDVVERRLTDDKLYIKYREKKTGKIIEESIDKDMVQAYDRQCKEYLQLTPEAQRISTAIHEREHIHQYTQYFQLKGFDTVKPTSAARTTYEAMIKDMPPIDPKSPQALEIAEYLTPAPNRTPLAYIKTPIEILARKAQATAQAHPTFIKLNNVFAQTAKMKDIPMTQNLLINFFRFENKFADRKS